LANFNNFWHTTVGKNLTQITHFNTVATLPCELQKS